MKADRLRAEDEVFCSGGGSFLLAAVIRGKRYTRLVPASPWMQPFSVPNSCRFTRAVHDRTINMRPDLVGCDA